MQECEAWCWSVTPRAVTPYDIVPPTTAVTGYAIGLGKTICCFHSLANTQTLRRALTVSVDSCTELEIKSTPSVA